LTLGIPFYGDGFGNPAKPFQACTAPERYVANMDDTDDTNPKIHPVK